MLSTWNDSSSDSDDSSKASDSDSSNDSASDSSSSKKKKKQVSETSGSSYENSNSASKDASPEPSSQELDDSEEASDSTASSQDAPAPVSKPVPVSAPAPVPEQEIKLELINSQPPPADDDASDSNTDDSTSESEKIYADQPAPVIEEKIELTEMVVNTTEVSRIDRKGDLVYQFKSLSFVEIDEKIERFEVLDINTVKATEIQLTAFEAIAVNARLSREEKCKLMHKLLFGKNFHFHQDRLLKAEIMALFMEEPKCLQALYFELRMHVALTGDVELNIWNKLIQASTKNGQTILAFLLKNLPAQKGYMLNFISCWMSNTNTTGGVYATYAGLREFIAKSGLKHYDDDIKDIVRLRIDAIKLSQSRFTDDNTDVRKFMKPRRCLFFSCVSTNSPQSVYKLVKTNKNAAKTEFTEAENLVTEHINKKLQKDPEQRIAFNMKA